MNKGWAKKIKDGVMPSTLLSAEWDKNPEMSGNDLASMFLEELPFLDVQVFYPIWNWEKPNRIRKNGISNERMDEWILKLIKAAEPSIDNL